MRLTDSQLAELQAIRDLRRNGRLTFDCRRNSLCQDGDRVMCRAGHTLQERQGQGTMSFLAVMRGWTPTVCRTCLDYDDEE